MPKRRRQYRVKPAQSTRLSAWVAAADARLLPGAVEDLSACGLRLCFKPQKNPRCVLGTVVNIRLNSNRLLAPLTVPSLVIYRGETTEGLVYGFEFIDWLGLLQALPDEVKALFNQRRDHRVTPRRDRPVVVTLWPTCSSLEAKVHAQDVSTTGLSFVIGGELESALAEVEVVDLTLRLPSAGEDLCFTGKILSRALTSEGVRYGLCLVEDGRKDFERRVTALSAYVASRHRELVGLGAPRAAARLPAGAWPSTPVR